LGGKRELPAPRPPDPQLSHNQPASAGFFFGEVADERHVGITRNCLAIGNRRARAAIQKHSSQRHRVLQCRGALVPLLLSTLIPASHRLLIERAYQPPVR
jgi:hypothetical protein